MGCDEISKLSIRLRNVVLATLTVLQIFNNIMLFRSSALKSFWKRDIVQIEMEKIHPHNEVLFCIQFGASSIWSWIWRINVIQRRLCYIILISIYHWHRTSNILFITHERNWSWERKRPTRWKCEFAYMLPPWYQNLPLPGYQNLPLPGYQNLYFPGYQNLHFPGYQNLYFPVYQNLPLPSYQNLHFLGHQNLRSRHATQKNLSSVLEIVRKQKQWIL